MPAPGNSHDGPKRKPMANAPETGSATKKQRSETSQPERQNLRGPHEIILTELAPKYNVLPLSVISSTKINSRVASITSHVLEESDRPRIALLYSRPKDIVKLISVVEVSKQALTDEGKHWYQYNQFFELPEMPNKRGVVEDTVLQPEGDDSSDSDDDFEVMQDRFEAAILPPAPPEVPQSMRVFLSVEPIPELQDRKGTSIQTWEDPESEEE